VQDGRIVRHKQLIGALIHHCTAAFGQDAVLAFGTDTAVVSDAEHFAEDIGFLIVELKYFRAQRCQIGNQ
jgi:hypothetical protein